MTSTENYYNPLPGNPGRLMHLFHPAQAFQHPMEVVADQDLTLSEKRAILAAWASDACATAASTALRSNGATVVRVDDIFEALSVLDREDQKSSLNGWATRELRRQKIDRLRNASAMPVSKLRRYSASGGSHAI